jgi:hypothetical protein
MEGGTIVPEVIRVRRLPRGDVRDDPVDFVSATAEPLNRFLESLCGKVKYRYPAESYRAGRCDHWLKVKNQKHPAFSRVVDQF